MNSYEILYVYSTTMTDEKEATLNDRIKSQIEAGGGTVDSVDDWGVRRLAYPIKKELEGHYVLLNFQASSEKEVELDKQVRLFPGVLRYVIVRKDK